MNRFIFKNYNYDRDSNLAEFNYAFEDGRKYREVVSFDHDDSYDTDLLNRALFLAFVIIGVSYYKCFPSTEAIYDFQIDSWQAEFFNHVFQEGLGQFAFENNLTRNDLLHFIETDIHQAEPKKYFGTGIIALQSGGKDSLLVASLIEKAGRNFDAYYVSNSNFYPDVLNKISANNLLISKRQIDIDAIKNSIADGGLNGHVPVTYIVQSLALIQAILKNKNQIIVSIAHEGEEPHYKIGDMNITHQWSKTWRAEKDFAKYVKYYISPDIQIGSPTRQYSELKIAELFAAHSWKKFGHDFSSCNVSNYRVGNNNQNLNWCGSCPKCANSYLLFAPFIESKELRSLFSNEDLFEKPELAHTFRGLLGIDNEPKPFECIGEINELRVAYVMALKNGYHGLPFEVPESDFNYLNEYEAQTWAKQMLQ